MPEIREVVWYLALEWRYEIGCRTLRSRLNNSVRSVFRSDRNPKANEET
jgi:hypothetical protein